MSLNENKKIREYEQFAQQIGGTFTYECKSYFLSAEVIIYMIRTSVEKGEVIFFFEHWKSIEGGGRKRYWITLQSNTIPDFSFKVSRTSILTRLFGREQFIYSPEKQNFPEPIINLVTLLLENEEVAQYITEIKFKEGVVKISLEQVTPDKYMDLYRELNKY